MLGVSGGLFLAGAVAWKVWVSRPARLHQQQVAQLLSDQSKLWQTQQSLYAHDSSRNCYLNPQLLEVWQVGKSGGSASARRLIEACRPHSSQASEISAALIGFEPLVPVVLRASQLPVWVWPGREPQRLTAPNYRNVQEVAQAISVYADQLISKGDYDRALECILAVRRLAHAMGAGDLTIMGLASAVQIQWMSHVELIRLLRKRGFGLEAAVGQIEATALTMDLLASAAPMEILCFHNTLNQREGAAQLTSIRTRTPRTTWARLLSRLPGLVDRELRLYDNDVMDSLDYWKGGTREAATQRTMHTVSDDVSGRQSFLSPVSLRQFWYVRRQVLKAQAWQGAERLMIGLEAYRHQHGRYPDSLKDLNLAVLPENPLYKKKGFLYELMDGQPDLVIPVSLEFEGLLHAADRLENTVDSKGVHVYRAAAVAAGANSLPLPGKPSIPLNTLAPPLKPLKNPQHGLQRGDQD